VAAQQRPIKSAFSNDQAAAAGDRPVWILRLSGLQAVVALSRVKPVEKGRSSPESSRSEAGER
jgi:hypothetical protein